MQQNNGPKQELECMPKYEHIYLSTLLHSSKGETSDGGRFTTSHKAKGSSVQNNQASYRRAEQAVYTKST